MPYTAAEVMVLRNTAVRAIHQGLGPEELDTEARLLYEQCPTPKSPWEQLGEATRSVWRERVLAGERADLA